MEQPTAFAPSPTPPSFAGLLAALATPAQESAFTWNDDDLADDFATLSYERALQAHARYRATDQSLTQAADPEPNRFEEPAPVASAATRQPAARSTANLEPNANPDPSRLRAAQFERNLKAASITIRMSKAECRQLHRRAAEAGLTVSAYLRSCTFEAESLRAMVKDTLAQLRSATTPARPAPPRRSWFGRLARWMARLLTPWHGSQRVARA